MTFKLLSGLLLLLWRQCHPATYGILPAEKGHYPFGYGDAYGSDAELWGSDDEHR